VRGEGGVKKGQVADFNKGEVERAVSVVTGGRGKLERAIKNAKRELLGGARNYPSRIGPKKKGTMKRRFLRGDRR